MIFRSRLGNEFSEDVEVTFSTYNALNNEENKEKFAKANIQEVKKAIELSRQVERFYRNTTAQQRASFLNSIATELQNNKEEILEMYCKESSLSTARAANEFERTINTIHQFANFILSNDWNKPLVSNPNNSHYTITSKYFPIGPVVVFGASNFPLAYSTAGGDTIAALAAGCPVIVKAHPYHAGTSYLVSECIIKSIEVNNLPNGIFSHILDNGYELGEELVRNENIRAIGFTGSIKGGRALMDIASKRRQPIPVFAEMGSINPVIFFDNELEKNSELWLEKFAISISTDGGQFCTKPGLILLPSSDIGIEFPQNLQKQLLQIEPQCHLHPNLFHNFKKQVENSFNWIPCNKANHSQPYLQIMDIDSFLNNYNCHEEFFGPQAIAVHYKNIEEIKNILEKLQGQLTFTFIGSEKEINIYSEIVELATEKAGRLIFNGVPTGVAVCDAMVHSGTYPASSDCRFTAVGTHSIYRFMKPISFQRLK